jgi:hypothetical protein
METVQWILLFSLYVFAGINIGQLTNLVNHERNEYDTDNRYWLAVLWLPVAILAMIEHLKGRAAEAELEKLTETRNEIWERVQSDWATREFTGPAMPYIYPWETTSGTKLDFPPGFDDAAGWADRKVLGIDRGRLSPELLATMPSPLSQSPWALSDGDLEDLKLHDPKFPHQYRKPLLEYGPLNEKLGRINFANGQVVESILRRKSQTFFPQPLTIVEPTPPDTVEPAGDTLASETDFADDFIQRNR